MTERSEELKKNRMWKDAHGKPFYTVDKGGYDWLIQQAELSREWQLVATDRFNDWYKADQLNNRYKQALELVEDELEYAKTTGNDEVRDMYIKNSIRFINEALEGEE